MIFKTKVQKLFFKRELEVLGYKDPKRLLFFASVFCMILLAVQIAAYSYHDLESKMKDPYSNLIKTEIPLNQEHIYNGIISEIENDYMDSFAIDHVDRFLLNNIDGFINTSNFERYQAKRRTVEAYAPLTQKIFEAKNVISLLDSSWIAPKLALKRCGVVITPKLAKRLSLEENPKRIFISILGHIIDIELIAIVKQLPDKAEIAMLNGLQQMIENSNFGSAQNKGSRLIDLDLDSSNVINLLFFPEHQENISKLEADLSHYNPSRSDYKILYAENKYIEQIKFNFSEALSVSDIDSLNQIFSKQYGALRYPAYDWICSNQEEVKEYDFVGFYFSDLGMVRKFSNHLERKNILLDISNVVTKENFSLVAKLTFFLTIGLFVLGMILLFVLLFSLLTKYFNSNKAQFGMLKAYGLSNAFIHKAYGIIASKFILKVIAIAFLLNGLFLCAWYGVKIAPDLIFSIPSLFTVVAACILTWLTTYSAVKFIVNATPGKLIYGKK